jgi:integration host factor subunit alpha
MALTKSDIARRIADDCGFLKGGATDVLEKLLKIIKDRLVNGEYVVIAGFGKWTVKSKRARRGRNPKTGEQMLLDARRVVAWKYSPFLKNAVNKDSDHRIE